MSWEPILLIGMVFVAPLIMRGLDVLGSYLECRILRSRFADIYMREGSE